MSKPNPSAGWYPDPEHQEKHRFWDGAAWTEQQRPAAVEAESSTGGPEERGSLADAKIPLFGARNMVRELRAENAELREVLARNGALSLHEAERRRDQAMRGAAKASAEYDGQVLVYETKLAELRDQVVASEDLAMLQEAGVYEYRHPLDDALSYQSELKRLRDQVKVMNRKNGGAVVGITNWTVNSSAVEGRKMVRDFSKLMLRAYNAEADNLVRSLKPFKLESAIDRLTKVAATIVKLGATMHIRVTDEYHRLRIRELELTADYLEKIAEEKERDRAEKARLREEKKAQQEMERERRRLEKERQHNRNALEALEAQGDDEAVGRLREKLEEIDRAIADVDYRAANVRAGYVYVISNVGSFGDRIVKIGMTRRLEPGDRVRELSDASVPFNFDTHALFFSQDAVTIESELHARLADRRVNLVNRRREFFYATPEEVREHLRDVSGDILQFEAVAEAVEYHQSENERRGLEGSD